MRHFRFYNTHGGKNVEKQTSLGQLDLQEMQLLGMAVTECDYMINDELSLYKHETSMLGNLGNSK